MRLLKESKRVWITGASSGIGEECAVEFARRGASLVISGRRLAELDRVAERCRQAGASRVRILAFDLSDTGILEEVSAKAWEFYGGIDILYCNAGISQRCDTDEADIQTIRKVMEVDYFAPVIITKAILHRMLQSGGGQLACTGSIAGLVLIAATPRMMEDVDAGWDGMSPRRLEVLRRGLELTHGQGLFGRAMKSQRLHAFGLAAHPFCREKERGILSVCR